MIVMQVGKSRGQWRAETLRYAASVWEGPVEIVDEIFGPTLFHGPCLIGRYRCDEHDNTIRPHGALGYRPLAPLTVMASRCDPPCAVEGLRATRRVTTRLD